MYLPAHFEEKDPKVLHAHIAEHPLGAWVLAGGGGLTANHVPFLVHPGEGPLGTLTAHVARANPVWKSVPGGPPSLVIFQGPSAYISPSWYPSKAEHGKMVPTWNYAAVHAHGVARLREERDWLLAHVGELTSRHEAGRPAPWKAGDAPADFIERMLGSIVGIEIPIDRLEGKWKVGQNREVKDQEGAASGLLGTGNPEAARVAGLMRESAARRV
jgi:transcriptional regulator